MWRVQPLLWLRAAFTRLLPNSGQPLYGWLAEAANLLPARFSGLQDPNSTPIRFLGNRSPLWLKPEEKPVRKGLESYHWFIDGPAVKRLAFTLEISRVNAAFGKTSVPQEGYFTNVNSSSSVHGPLRSAVAERTARTVEGSTGWVWSPH